MVSGEKAVRRFYALACALTRGDGRWRFSGCLVPQCGAKSGGRRMRRFHGCERCSAFVRAARGRIRLAVPTSGLSACAFIGAHLNARERQRFPTRTASPIPTCPRSHPRRMLSRRSARSPATGAESGTPRGLNRPCPASCGCLLRVSFSFAHASLLRTPRFVVRLQRRQGDRAARRATLRAPSRIRA